MSIMLRFGFGLLTLLISTNSFSVEKENACLKYEKETGWSKAYDVEANLYSGTELNRAVNSYTRFKSYSNYAVVFWGEGQATILELPSYYIGQLPIVYSNVNDQYGRKWSIQSKGAYCF